MISESEIELYKKILPGMKVVFDVGCQNDNIFYELNNELQVHLFDPVNNDSLSRNGNIKFNNHALGNKVGLINFHFHYGSILLRDDEPKFAGNHQTVKIWVDTLFEYCKRNKIKSIDLLKIDTEGYDFEVIKGCRKMIENIKYIQFEFWETNNADIIEFFKGYNIYTIGGKPLNLLATKERLNLKYY